jgi:hypothetical protein
VDAAGGEAVLRCFGDRDHIFLIGFGVLYRLHQNVSEGARSPRNNLTENHLGKKMPLRRQGRDK